MLTDIAYIGMVSWMIEANEKASRGWPIYVYKITHYNSASFENYNGNNTAEFPVQGEFSSSLQDEQSDV